MNYFSPELCVKNFALEIKPTGLFFKQARRLVVLCFESYQFASTSYEPCHFTLMDIIYGFISCYIEPAISCWIHFCLPSKRRVTSRLSLFDRVNNSL
jgi:hypothetical protein